MTTQTSVAPRQITPSNRFFIRFRKTSLWVASSSFQASRTSKKNGTPSTLEARSASSPRKRPGVLEITARIFFLRANLVILKIVTARREKGTGRGNFEA